MNAHARQPFAVLTLALAFLSASAVGTAEAQQPKPGPAAAQARKVVLQVQGRLTADDPVVRGAHFKVHPVKLEAGIVYRIDLIGVGKLDTYLRLEDAAGKVLEEDDDGGDGLNARIIFRPGVPGVHRVVATTFAQGATGKYALIVAEATDREEKVWQSNRLWSAAQAAYRQGKDTAAIQLIEKLLTIDRALYGNQHGIVVSSLQFLAKMREERAEFAAARVARKEVLAIRKKQHGANSWQATDARLDLEHTDRLKGLTAEQRLGLREADTFLQQASANNRPGKYRTGAAWARKALEARRAILGADHRLIADSANWTGFLLEAQGDRPAARKYLEQALAIRQKVLPPDHPALALSLNNLGLVLNDLGDWPAARKYLEQALALRQKVLPPDHPDLATSLNSLGSVLHDLGDRPAARKYLEQALAIRQKVLPPDHPDLALSLNNLGSVLQDLGDRPAARKYIEQALAIYQKVLPPDHPVLAQSLNNLGAVLHDLGDRPAARKYLEQALAIHQKVLPPDHPALALSLNNLGSVLHALGDRPVARKYHEQALAILQKVLPPDHPDLARSLNNLGSVLHALGDRPTARKHYEQALQIAQGNLELAAAAQSERVQLAMTGNLRYYLDTLLSLPTAAADDNAMAYARVLTWKGAVFARQRRQRLLRHASSDPELRKDFLRLEEVSRQLANLALADPGKTRIAQRLKELEQLTGEKERLEEKLAARSQAFRRDKQLARLTPQALVKVLPPDAALVDFLEYWYSEPTEKGPSKFERRFLAFVLRPGRPVARIELGAAEPIRKTVDAWRQKLIGAHWIKEDARAAELRAKIWLPLEKHLDGAHVVLLAPDGALNRLPFVALPGKKAGTFLLEERLLAIVPVPQWLPEVLTERKESGKPSLLVLGDVDYGAPAGKPAEVASSQRAARAGVLSRWDHLDATRAEILLVRDAFDERFPDGRVKLLRKAVATESAFRKEAPCHAWLHLATHGFFAPPTLRSALALKEQDGLRPLGRGLFERQAVSGYHPGLLSGLVLAGANRPLKAGSDDGILTALEVAALDLDRVQMVVLSACETGLGETAGGEGLLGLQRAFQVAGAGTVVATLWTVHDKGTAAFMGRFYDNLWGKKKLGKLEAMREAQLWMLHQGRRELRGLGLPEGPDRTDQRLPPRYWAGFVLSGDWR